MLKGKKGLVVGVANSHSLAYGCARHFRDAGADLAITYLNAKTEKYVHPLAEELGCEIARPCDVSAPGALESVFEEIGAKWGRLDFALHSIGYARADDLHGRVIDCSADGFAHAMTVSVHSFLRMARLAEPLMTSGGCLLALTYYGGQKAVQHYGVMGLVKGALETAIAYMAVELGGRTSASTRYRRGRSRRARPPASAISTNCWTMRRGGRRSTASSRSTTSARSRRSW